MEVGFELTMLEVPVLPSYHPYTQLACSFLLVALVPKH